MSEEFFCLCPNDTGQGSICCNNIITSGSLDKLCTACGWKVSVDDIFIMGSDDYKVCMRETEHGTCRKINKLGCKLCSSCAVNIKENNVSILPDAYPDVKDVKCKGIVSGAANDFQQEDELQAPANSGTLTSTNETSDQDCSLILHRPHIRNARMKITFHATISKKDTSFKQIFDELFVRFESRNKTDPEFRRDLKMCTVSSAMQRITNDDLIYMTGDVEVNRSSLVGHSISYQYMHFTKTPDGHTECQLFEENKTGKRVLQVPPEGIDTHDMIDQYDGLLMRWPKRTTSIDESELFTDSILLMLPSMEGLFGNDDCEKGNVISRRLCRRVWNIASTYKDKVLQPLQSYMAYNIGQLETIRENGRRIVAALVLLSVVVEFEVSMSKLAAANLCRALLITAVPEEEPRCGDWEEVKSNFSDNISLLASYLACLLTNVIREHAMNEIVYVLPLFHFTNELSQPYTIQPLPVTDHITPQLWGLTDEIEEEIQTAKQKHPDFGTLGSRLEELKPLFACDPLLERSLVAIASKSVKDLTSLIRLETLSLDAILATATHFIKRSGRIEEIHLMMQELSRIVHQSIQAPVNEAECGVLQLACELAKTLISDPRLIHEARGAFSIVLFVLSAHLREPDHFDHQAEGLLAVLETFVRSESEKCHDAQTCAEFAEILFEFMSIKICADDVSKLWIENLYQSLEKFLKQLSPLLCLETLCIIQIHDMKELINEVSVLHIQHLLLENDEVVNRIFELLHHHRSEWLAVALSECLLKRLPPGESSVKWLNLILTWSPLTQLLLSFKGRHPLSQPGKKYFVVPETYKIELNNAIHRCENVYTRICDGQITMKELEIVLANQRNFFQLLECTIDGIKSLEDTNALLMRRKEELYNFKEYKNQLQTLISLFKKANPKCARLLTLQEGLNESVDRMTIFDQLEPRLHDSEANAIEAIVGEVDHLANNRLFLLIWDKTIEECQSSLSSIADIIRLIWDRAVAVFRKMVSELKSGTISLQNILLYFNDTSYEQIAMDFSDIGIDEQTSAQRLKQIQTFFELDDMHQGARAILNCKKALALSGDFSKLRKLLALMEETEDESLTAITNHIVRPFQVIRLIGREEKRALLAFEKCLPTVLWLRENVKGNKEIKVLVDLALLSAKGRGDHTLARVRCLQSAVAGYYPLIYNIQSSDGLVEFFTCCKDVFRTIANDKDLPNKLIDCNHQLDWIKKVRASHGTMEVDAITQAENINKGGTYEVRSSELPQGQGDPDTSSVLRLSVNTAKGQSQYYTYQQVCDLHRKLMLVAGQAEVSKGQVEKFAQMFTAVVRLSSLHDELNKSGCMLFKQWKSTFVCGGDVKPNVHVFPKEGSAPLSASADNVVSSVTVIADFMAKCLTEWTDYISRCRDKHTSLNAFTTKQLIYLCRHLKPGLSLDKWAFPLLQRVLSGCSLKDVKEAFVAVAALEEAAAEAGTSAAAEAAAKRATEAVSGNDLSDGQTSKNACGELTQRMFPFCFSRVHPSAEDNDIALIYNPLKRMKKAQTKDMLNLVEEMNVSTGLGDHLRNIWRSYLKNISTNVGDYLSIEKLGLILEQLFVISETDLTIVIVHDSTPNVLGPCKLNREMPSFLQRGTPNLVVVNTDQILPAVLSLYLDKHLPLPGPDEVLMCTETTSAEEVELIWLRAVGDAREQRTGKVYCMANAQFLNYAACQQLEQCLFRWQREPCGTLMQIVRNCLPASPISSEYSLVVICSEGDKRQSHAINILHAFRRQFPMMHSIGEISEYLKLKFTTHSIYAGAWMADKEKSRVRLIKSLQAGVGKGTCVMRIQEIAQHQFALVQTVTIPLHDKSINIDALVALLLEKLKHPNQSEPQIFHIDLSHTVQKNVDHVLFSMLVLGSLCHSSGLIWNSRPKDLFLIECLPMQKPDQNRQLVGAISNTKEVYKKVNISLQRSQYVHSVLGLLPSLVCWSPEDSLRIMRKDFKGIEQLYPSVKPSLELDQLMDHKIFRSPEYQKAYGYLAALVNNPNANSQENCIEVLLQFCGIRAPSWAELRFFTSFLHEQLVDFEASVFCSKLVADDLPGFQEFVLKSLIQMSKDFATRSLAISEENPTMTQLDGGYAPDLLQRYSTKRTWESKPHPYLFFNATDNGTFTFLGFHVHPRTGDAIDPESGSIIEKSIMPQNLQMHLEMNKVPLRETFGKLSRAEKIAKLCTVMGLKHDRDPDRSYELTNDNVTKMLAIYMRFRCGIPVIIMGETGCGKTRLIKFLCDLNSPPGVNLRNVILVKVHGGTSEADLKHALDDSIKTAKCNQENHGANVRTILFLDEVNTTDAVGSIKEILCDRHFSGKPIPQNIGLSIVAACNPYRTHSKAMIERLEKAGLGYRVRAEETEETFGCTPLRQLVYRVHPLPLSLLPLVWDFGQLDHTAEVLYVKQIVQHSNEVSFVSLRDVERVLKVFDWFLKQTVLMTAIETAVKKEKDDFLEMHFTHHLNWDNEEMERLPLHKWTRALVLSLGVCYQSCLEMDTRVLYRQRIAPKFKGKYRLPHLHHTIESEISRCQDVILDDIRLDGNIARNHALKENVFMMLVCIELRIPLFLVGKPGSSKSLAKTIIEDAMQRNLARNPIFCSFKQVHMISFQCSQLSTPDGILETFHECALLQKDKNLDEFVSVVVLDEIGLAEDSPKMPLKTLHPLLEDGCIEHGQATPHQKVAFIGISNWALDPAKMNRGILVQRGIPDEDELERSAEGICGDKNNLSLVKHLLRPIAQSYNRIFDEAIERCKEEFFGLRDFYGLIKTVCHSVANTRKQPTAIQLKRAVLQNFGGLDGVDPLQVFSNIFPIEQSHFVEHDIDCSPLSLIKENLQHSIASESESRYLLILTENYAALGILQQEIPKTRDAVIIFGSSFPKDLDYTQVCRNINRIKICMETGRTVILLNLENLYESLYDALNQVGLTSLKNKQWHWCVLQYYVYLGGERFVDLGLGNQRVKCKVHENFRMMVVAEKDMVYKRFPIPLINRLEKHILATDTLLTPTQRNMYIELECWVERFANRPRSADRVSDVFIGFHQDTVASIILRVSKDFHSHDMNDSDQMVELCKENMLLIATPDSILRLGKTPIDRKEVHHLGEVYFEHQKHASLGSFLANEIHEATDHALCRITTYDSLPVDAERRRLADLLEIPVDDLILTHLKKFDTEQQFCQEVREYVKQRPSSKLGRIMLVVCDSGQHNSKLIACAQHTISNECVGSRWFNVHIDELSDQIANNELAPAHTLQGKTLSCVLEETDHVQVSNLLVRCVHSVVGMIEDPQKSDIKIRRVDILMKLLTEPGYAIFVDVIKKRLIKALRKSEAELVENGGQPTQWLADRVALLPVMRQTGTLRRAVVHYIESRLSPFLAQTMSFLDTNANLNLALRGRKFEWTIDLWMSIFSDDRIPGLNIRFTGATSDVFEAKVPFSWLVKETIDQIIQQKSTFTDAARDIHSLFMESSIGQKVLMHAPMTDLFDLYAHDFVRMVYKPQSACPAEEYQTPHLACRPLEVRIFLQLTDEMKPPNKDVFDSVEFCRQWEEQAEEVAPILTQIIFRAENSEELGHVWHRLLTIRLFLKHAVLPDDSFQLSNRAFSLWETMGEDFNPKEMEHLSRIEQLLNQMGDKKAKSRSRVQISPDQMQKCNAFFMELVSQLCFSRDRPPSDEVIERLMEYVTNDDTVLAIPAPRPPHDIGICATPVVRSFILQLLLKYDVDLVREHLNAFVNQSKMALQNPDGFNQLSMLVTVCFQDYFERKLAKSSYVDVKVKRIVRYMEQCKNIENPEHVALVRACFGELAVWIANMVNGEPGVPQLIPHVLKHAAELCKKHGLLGPRAYLLKQLAHRYSFDLALETSKSAELQWIIPEALINKDNIWVADRFLVCGNSYAELRDIIEAIVFLVRDLDVLRQITENSAIDEYCLLLSLHRNVTQQLRHQNEAMRPKTEPFEGLLSNTLPGLLHCELEHPVSGLSQVAMHLHAVLAVVGNTSLCRLLSDVLHNPENLQGVFLPTMPEDDIAAIRAAIVEKWAAVWICPNGHPYVIGNCGRPMEASKCKECGATIGGRNHQQSEGNTRMHTEDNTKPGHILGSSERRLDRETTVRSLTPTSMAIMRCLLHCAMHLGSTVNARNLSVLIQPPVKDVPGFLEAHLRHDLRQLQRAVGCSKDDVFLLLHYTLHQMRSTAANQQGAHDLRIKAGRDRWEEEFCEAFITPVIQAKDAVLQAANTAMANDEQTGHGKLMKLIYEVDESPEKQALWKYRPSITVDNLLHKLHEKKDNELELVRCFLSRVNELAAIRHLPNIVALLERLRLRYSYIISRADASKTTISEMKRAFPASVCIEDLLESFTCAWKAVRKHLNNYVVNGRVLVPAETCNEVDDDSPLAMLLPSTRGIGGCALALLHFLCEQQNEFLGTFARIRNKRMSERSLPVSAALEYHLIICDPTTELYPLLVAYQSYSVKQTLDSDYNFHALQDKILERFVAGRALLKYEENTLIFSDDYPSMYLFDKLSAVVHQVKLPSEAIDTLLRTSWELPELCTLLGRLDTAISFLISIGGQGDTLLTDFLDNTLRMRHRMLHSVVEQCQLKHVVHLWKLLSMQKAQLLSYLRQDPFEALPDEFKEAITTDMQTQLHPMSKVNKRLQRTIHQMLFNYMLDVLIPQSRESEDTMNYPLRDCLVEIPSVEEDATLMDIVGSLPEELLNKHLAATWTYIVNCTEASKF
ncbi:hypothetical protein CAPTEDRAFT_201549 [Capitella teleta]|uniref:RZ-type domain-containing protein n=1 Tax=Capitella teleta TaxID=283909 RepID=R7U8N7_CAPTE|nr:hypothetical protein CAPTEDRAFT_201549 [Capitella teleta]|eukprot:ELU02735.1 hypothetical protein CAPTEDRAFT_201549 [Capitella teleta]